MSTKFLLEKFLFKKIEIWIVALLCIVFIVFSLLFGALLLGHERGSPKFYRLGKLATETVQLVMRVRQILTFEPTGVTMGAKRFGARAGLNIDKEFKPDAIVVIPTMNDELGEWQTLLVDLKTQRSTSLNLFEVMSAATSRLRPNESKVFSKVFRRESAVIKAPRFDNSLNLTLVTNSGILMQVGSEQQLQWANAEFRFHHTFNFTDDNKDIWAIGTDINEMLTLPPVYSNKKFINDAIIKIDSKTGEIKDYFNITEAMIEAKLDNHLFIGRFDRFAADPLHINDVQPVSIDGKYFSKSDIFISLGHANMVVLYDTLERKIKWHSTRGLYHQHDVDILDDTTIAIFNNNRVYTDVDKTFKHNQIVSYDFSNNKNKYLHDDIFLENDIRTVSQGLFDFTDYGLLREETNYGRFLIFKGTKKVFEFLAKNEDGYSTSLGWSYLETDKSITSKIRKRYFK